MTAGKLYLDDMARTHIHITLLDEDPDTIAQIANELFDKLEDDGYGFHMHIRPSGVRRLRLFSRDRKRWERQEATCKPKALR